MRSSPLSLIAGSSPAFLVGRLRQKDKRHLFRKQNEIADSSTLADAGYFIFGDGDNFEDGPNYGKFHFNNNMAITKDGIQFLYNAYEMAPYAAGRPSITLPYAMLQPYLKVKIW